MAERSPEDVLAGVLRIAVGGRERIVPTLSIRATREWQQEIARGPGGFSVPVSDDDWSAADVADFSGLTLQTVLDVVVAYDRTGALGGREWLEENADPAQLYAAASQMAEAAFPFATDTRLLLAALVVRSILPGAAPSADPSSTSGRSRTGGSTRGRSRAASTRGS
jgi:hypothetical protein